MEPDKVIHHNSRKISTTGEICAGVRFIVTILRESYILQPPISTFIISLPDLPWMMTVIGS